MLAVQGYYDGTAIQTLEKINARPNQRVIITIMDEFLTPAINAERKSMRGVLAQYEQMAEKAEKYLDAGNVWVTIEVIAEVVYVLKGVYSLERDKITETIKDFLDLVCCQEHDVLLLALDTYAERNLDFVDCVLYSYHAVKNVEIATFDKKLLKLLSE